MPNPIIQNYLNDNNVPVEKRREVFMALETGDADEQKLANAITEKYGSIYMPIPRNEGGGEMPISEFQNTGAFRVNNTKPNMFDRVKNAFIKTGEASSREIGRFMEGYTNMTGARDNIEQLNRYRREAEKKLESGEYTQEQYDETMRYTGEAIKDENQRRYLGQSQSVRGLTGAAFSPTEGAITGGLEPELENLAGKAFSFYEDMTPKNQERFSGAINTLQDLAEDNPVLTNYLIAGLDVIGLKGSGGALKGARSGIRAAAPTIRGAAEDAVSAIGRSSDDLFKRGLSAGSVSDEIAGEALERGIREGVPSLKPPTRRNLRTAEELLRPLPTTTNLRQAAREGLADMGKKGIFRASPDRIRLSPRMEQSAKTLSRYFPRLKSETAASLPIKIQDKIGDIAKPLQETFKRIDIPPEVKSSLRESWDRLKRTQLEDIGFHPDVKRIQTKFDEIFDKLMSSKYRNSQGRYRRQNLNDMWDAVKAFDSQVGNRVRNALEKAPTDRSIAMHDAWLDTRRVLRDSMDRMANTIDDVNARNSFNEMSDLYQASNQLIKNVRRTNVSGDSVLKERGARLIKQAAPYAIGGTAAGVLFGG